MRFFVILAVAICSSLALGGCLVVDNFGSRVNSVNVGSHDVAKEEVLLNIVRASRFEPLNFIALTQVAGDQTADLKIGLPTLTFGPRQTALQRQITFANNSLEGNAKGSFQSNPLVSDTFQSGMLSPVDARIFALLAANYPRELLFYLMLDGIKLSNSAGVVYYYRNDPSDNLDAARDANFCESEFYDSARYPFGSPAFGFQGERSCNFSKFVRLMRLAVQRGITSEITVLPANGKDNDNKKIVEGHFCFDIGLVSEEFKLDTAREPNLCGKSKPVTKPGDFYMGLQRNVGISFVFRSPIGIYKALGKLLRDQTTTRIPLSDEFISTFHSARLIEVHKGSHNDCIISTSYDDDYCVERAGSGATLAAIEILEQLKNLSTRPSDLNTAFTVRLAGG